MDAIRARVRTDQLVVDGLLALALTLLSIVTLAAGARDIGALHPPSVALLLLQTIPLVARRVAPIPVLLVTGVATIAHALFAEDSLNTTLGALIALYTVAEATNRRTSAVLGIVLGVAMASVIAIKAPLPAALGSLVQTELAVLVSWLVGTWSRERRAYIGLVEDRAARAEQDREEDARRAVGQERERIARELHDVVTHHVSVIVIQAGAARRALGRRPEDVAGAITAIDTAGRRALTDMRRMLGILGTNEGQNGEPLEPMPGLDRLGELVESVRAAGLPVELSIVGERGQLDAGVELSVYRIIQEALTNSLRHAEGARARVAVRFEPAAVEIDVSDEGGADREGIVEPGRQGRGLIGMRERVAMFGGEFEAGRHGRGFRVRARLPIEPVTAT